MLEQIPLFLKVVAGLLTVGAAIIGVLTASKKYQLTKKKNAIFEDSISAQFIGQFNQDELSQALSGYVIPHCSPGDPANKEGEEYLADMRESVFEYMDRSIKESPRSYHLLMADTGMGKTSFCINYFVHLKKNLKAWKPCLLSLTSGDVLKRLDKIENKSNVVLIADAFDEDPQASENGRHRLSEILEASMDFRAVIITCRSQYFSSDDAIPRETPVSRLVPRQLNQSQNYALTRSYISPFSAKEIQRYIDGHFPIWKFWNLHHRLRAFKLVKFIPDLSHRPMLLERLPHLVVHEDDKHELYNLYDYMVEGWLARESRWISTENLRNVSYELALYIYQGLPENIGRISKQEIEKVSNDRLGVNPEWKYLTARSLLNRDSQGRYKFAHKSILEFILVKLAVSGDDRPISYKWTPFMKELFVSWGHSNDTSAASRRAQEMLNGIQGRANIAPLYDLWTIPPVIGLPDFKRSAERRLTHSGVRLAPPAWRDKSLKITKRADETGWDIFDPDFNLNWFVVDSRGFRADGIQENLSDLINIKKHNSGYRFPSYDQFVALIEGLHFARSKILSSGDTFLLADKPAKRSHLLAVIGNGSKSRPGMKLLDKDRKINGTQVTVSAFMASVEVSRTYASDIKVRQLWLTP